jgi:hypothetical protein
MLPCVPRASEPRDICGAKINRVFGYANFFLITTG